MIRSIKLTNFFSFQDETIELDPSVNVLVGVNGSGKSNLIKAIQLLKTGVDGNANDSALRELVVDKWGGFDNIYCKTGKDGEYEHSIGLEFFFDEETMIKISNGHEKEAITYKIVLIRRPSTDNYYISERIYRKDRKKEGHFHYLDFSNGVGRLSERSSSSGSTAYNKYEDYNPQELVLAKISEFDKERNLLLVDLKKAIKEIAVYNYFDTTPNSKLRGAVTATSSIKRLLPDGSNLPQILNLLKINHKDYFRKIRENLTVINDQYDGFDFNFMGSGQLELMLSEKGLNSAVHVTHVSDGTLRYLCLLAIVLNPHRGSFICIDEPEVGLHPDMLHTLSKLIAEAGAETTFILASHSENVLNNFQVEDIRVFEKDEHNTTKVQQYNEEQFEGWYDEFSPGNMWRAGDLGGNRW